MTKTNADGSYDLALADGKGGAGVLYLIASGGEAKLADGKGEGFPVQAIVQDFHTD